MEEEGLIEYIIIHADSHVAADEYDHAIPLYVRVLELLHVPGKESDVDLECDIQVKLANCYVNTKQYEKALYCCFSIHILLKNRYGCNSKEFALSYTNGATVLMRMGKFDEDTESQLQQAKQIFDELGDTKSLEYGKIIALFADLEMKRDSLEKQLEWLNHARSIFELYPLGYDYCDVIAKTAICLLYLDRVTEAHAMCVESLNMRFIVYGKQHYQYAVAHNDMALLFGKVASYTQGIVHLETAVRITAQALGRLHPNTIVLQDSLTYFYKKEAIHNILCNAKCRFRMCAHCNVFIDRLLLFERGTDFLVCGYCHDIAYCSQACSDANWPDHGAECGQPRPVRIHTINVAARDCCDHCLCDGAAMKCSRCKTVRYCDAKCQRTHWKLHKEKCLTVQGRVP